MLIGPAAVSHPLYVLPSGNEIGSSPKSTKHTSTPKTPVQSVAAAAAVSGGEEIANYYHENVFAPMLDIRAAADELEPMISEKYLTYPTYGQLLFGVN